MRTRAPSLRKLTTLVFYAGTSLAFCGEISEYYSKQSRENTNWAARAASLQKSRSYSQVQSTNHGITEIGIEHISGYFGGSPTYTFIARSDGTFHYKGEENVERTGEFSGTIPIWQFNALAQFIRDSGYMGFEDEYRTMVTDLPTTYTTVVMKGKRKVIRNYARAGPTALWAIEELINDLMAKADWKVKPELPKAPEPALPKATRYDNDPVLRAVYLDSFRKGYFDGWQGKYNLSVFAPTSDSDKARVLAYAEGLDAGRAAVAKWFGTNSAPVGPASPAPVKR